MTGTEFKAVEPLLRRMRPQRLEIARRVLVDGAGLQAVASEHGDTKQNVNDAVGIVWRAYERWRESQEAEAYARGLLLPPGWERVTLIAPKVMIDRFLAELAELAEHAAQVPAKRKARVAPGKPAAKRRVKST